VRVVIVDDEPLARSGVEARLAQHSDVQIVASCSTGREAASAINDLGPDLVFLDVQMPDLNGFDVLRKIPPSQMPSVVFLTAYDHYALEAFDVHAVDYLLKPIDEPRFARALERARAQIKTASGQHVERRLRDMLEQLQTKETRVAYESRFAVRTGRRVVIISVEDIDWVEATGDYVALHVGTKSHLLRQTMGRLELQLDPERFIRVHRSAIVHASRICELESLANREYLLRLTNGTKIRTSRRFSDKVDRWLQRE
jgi:two-component system LytT family response regulator